MLKTHCRECGRREIHESHEGVLRCRECGHVKHLPKPKRETTFRMSLEQIFGVTCWGFS